uniref:Ion transport domain-containing protein n=1 Tax=Setaria digitata TaxID=48799 RepID=A0A915PVB6_9BILA
MIAPVWHNKLIKISHMNQRFLIKIACCNSIITCIVCIISISTNNWLYTTEVLRYYVHPNNTDGDGGHEDIFDEPVYHKNATLGPWLFCWLDPATEFHCTKVNYFTGDEPNDVTTSVEWMANFACIIVYMAAVSKEVGNKIYAATKMDDPLFHYSYGYSFIMLKISFLGNELVALFSLVVYMAKRDERMFNRYQIRSLIAKACEKDLFKTNCSRQHMRFHRSIRTASDFLNSEC